MTCFYLCFEFWRFQISLLTLNPLLISTHGGQEHYYLLFTGGQLTQRRKYSKKEPTVRTQWRQKWCCVFEMKSSLVPAVGSQSTEVLLGCSLELSIHFSACKCCFLSCLVIWLGNSAHHGGWPPCLLQKSVVRQQASCCSHLPTILCTDKDVVLEQVTPKPGPIPSCSLSLTWLYPTLQQYF